MSNDRALKKHWLSVVEVLDIPKDLLGHLVCGSLVKDLDALPLESGLNLVGSTLLEVQDLVVLET